MSGMSGFEGQGRYASCEIATHVDEQGRELPYRRRRFLPPSAAAPLLVEVTLAEGERLDLLATRHLGDPEQAWRICEANEVMNPNELLECGARLRIPIPTFEVSR